MVMWKPTGRIRRLATRSTPSVIACSRLSVVGDERKRARKKSALFWRRTKARRGVRACKNFFNDPLLV